MVHIKTAASGHETELSYWSERVSVGAFDYDVMTASSSKGLVWLSFGDRVKEEAELQAWVKRRLPGWDLVQDQENNQAVFEQLDEYLAGKRQVFNLPLHQVGTDFQIKVWQELCSIPYGKTFSYGEIAERIGCHRGQRAVGLANNKNPISIVVPCHRVIGKNGSLIGYAGGIDKKKLLLNLERTISS